MAAFGGRTVDDSVWLVFGGCPFDDFAIEQTGPVRIMVDSVGGQFQHNRNEQIGNMGNRWFDPLEEHDWATLTPDPSKGGVERVKSSAPGHTWAVGTA